MCAECMNSEAWTDSTSLQQWAVHFGTCCGLFGDIYFGEN